jgi:hypothetical protein
MKQMENETSKFLMLRTELAKVGVKFWQKNNFV